jgi:diguanylate cyclase (GGDEF)-like protein
LLAIPAVASALVTLSTPFTGLYFSFDEANVYHHGPLFLVFAAASYCYLLFAFVFVIATARRKVIDGRTLVALLFFPLPPAIAGLFQMLYYGLVLIWPATVLSLLVIYINIQQRKLSSDYLTGAFNRRRLDEYAEARVREIRDDRAPPGRRAKRFAGFLADVDDFKQINDRLGHAAGDAALVAAVQLIRTCLRADDFLARYAGDEFVAILPLSSEEELAQVVSRIRARFAESALPLGSPCRLSLSIGGAVFDPEKDEDADRYIARLDSLMYLEKESKKALKSEGRK